MPMKRKSAQRMPAAFVTAPFWVFEKIYLAECTRPGAASHELADSPHAFARYCTCVHPGILHSPLRTLPLRAADCPVLRTMAPLRLESRKLGALGTGVPFACKIWLNFFLSIPKSNLFQANRSSPRLLIHCHSREFAPIRRDTQALFSRLPPC